MTLSKEAIEVAREIDLRFTAYINTSIDGKKSIPHRGIRGEAEVVMLYFAKNNLSRIVKEVLEARVHPGSTEVTTK